MRLDSNRKTLGIGLLGLGTVGSGVAEILARNENLLRQRIGAGLRCVRAVVNSPRRKRSGAAANIPTSTKVQTVVGAADVDVVVELIGGLEPARTYILEALAAGQHVVTANKAVMAAHGEEIMTGARRYKREVLFEAAVAGGVPIIRTLREGVAADRITAIAAILNGTTNFILDRMASGTTYDEALREAQDLGFAEADPTLDVGGGDAAAKLAILSALAFGVRQAAGRFNVQGITSLTPEVLSDALRMGYRVKLLASAERCGEALQMYVEPVMLPLSHSLAAVSGSNNGVLIHSDALGESLLVGPGAGGMPTGSAVVSDLVELGRNASAGASGRLMATTVTRRVKILPYGRIEAAYYARLSVEDRPGVLASVARVFGQCGISLKSVLQTDASGSGMVPIVMTTGMTSAAAMDKAVGRALALATVREPAQVLRLLPDASGPKTGDA